MDTGPRRRVTWWPWQTRSARSTGWTARPTPSASSLPTSWSGSTPRADPVDLQLIGVPEGRRFAAQLVGDDAGDPATYPGIYGVRPMQLSVPDGAGGGRALGMAGLTWVGVHPDHRRRGILTAMMRHHFEQTHRGGRGRLRPPRERAGHLRPARLRPGLPRADRRARPGLHPDRAASRRRGRDARRPGSRPSTTKACAQRRRQVDLDLLATNVGTIVGDDGFYAELGRITPEARMREGEPARVLFAVRDGRRRRLRRVHRAPTSGPTPGRRPRSRRGDCSGLRPHAWRWSAGSSTSTCPARSRSTASARTTRCCLGPGSARARRRPAVRQPLDPARRPGPGPGVRVGTRPSATSSWTSTTRPRRGTPAAGGSGSRTAPPR